MDEKEKIEICNFWIRYPSMLGDNPMEKDEDDIANLLCSIAGSGGLTIGKVEDYKMRLEKHLLQKEANELQKKSISFKRTILIIIITVIVTAVISNIDRII